MSGAIKEIPVVFRKRWIDSHCSRCIDYVNKGRMAQEFNDLFGTTGIWDFDTCYHTCWHNFESEHNKRARERHQRLRGIKI